jgi:hypothetical protein
MFACSSSSGWADLENRECVQAWALQARLDVHLLLHRLP